jgi:glutamate-1-semialdehyde 2,1-aminomutase
VARAATGRSRVLKFDGCYHGHADGMLVRAGSGLAGRAAASSAGIPDGTLAYTLVAILDDERDIDRAFDSAAGDLAAVILEPVPANYGLLPQRPAWLAHLMSRARAAGVLVVFDEVITGFRTAAGGAAEAFGVEPDLVCYGKVIGGGFPVAAYGGRRELMDLVAPVGPVYQAGTLSANPVGMRAGLATLEQMADRDGWTALENQTGAFVDALRDRLRSIDDEIDVERHASMFWIHRRGADETLRRPDRIPPSHAEWYRAFFHRALAHGIYLPPSPYEVCFLSMAHDEFTLTLAADALADAAREVLGP